jgi:hypothetical protein
VQALPAPPTLVRLGLVVFVLVWIFGPYELQAAVPIWVPFLIALGLELHFFVGAYRAAPAASRDRGPQDADREELGYGGETDELVLVRDGDEELWVPYAGETPEELAERIAEERELEEEETGPAPAAPESRPWRGLVLGVGLIAALAALFWVVESQTGWNGLSTETRAAATERFSAEASRIAGKPVTIRCDESGDYVGAVQHADGVAVVGGDLAYLTPERCLDLYRLAFKGEVRSSRTGRAIAVLAHESWHLRGLADEGATECYAFQSGVELGRRLGLSADHARQLMTQQLVENTGRTGSSLEYRVPSECRDGGRLDLNPGDERFPSSPT